VSASDEAAAWDRFVEQQPEARFSQLWGFREALERAYAYRCVYRKVTRGDEWVGVFPSIAAGRNRPRLISMPFNEYGGPLFRGLAPGELADSTEAFARLAEQEHCVGVEIRGGIGCDEMEESRFCRKHRLHSYAVLALDEKERLWKQSLANEARKAIKRSAKAGLGVEIVRGPGAVASPFYEMYLVSMKRLGVPPHGREFFTHLAAQLGERMVASVVIHEKRRIAHLLGFLTGKRIQAYITASAPEAWPLRPNDLAHWELMNWAYTNGIEIFDFGSARYEGQIHFKQKWGAMFHDYNSYLIGPPNSKFTQHLQSVESSSKLMAASAAVWRHGVPLRLSSVLGPPIRKHLTK